MHCLLLHYTSYAVLVYFSSIRTMYSMCMCIYIYMYTHGCVCQHISSIFQQFASPATSNVPHLRKAMTQDAKHHWGRLTKCVTGMCHLLLRPHWNLQKQSLHLDYTNLRRTKASSTLAIKEDGIYYSKGTYIEYCGVLITVLRRLNCLKMQVYWI